MLPTLDILIPLRNPGPKLSETIASLLAQTDRRFAVILSNNFSESGVEQIAEAESKLRAGGIPVRRLRPAFSLGRVAHWNWLHAQAQGEWLKPLFVGDVLMPNYVARLRERIEARPASVIVRCEFELRSDDGLTEPAPRAPFDDSAVTPQQFLFWFPQFGNWVGRPVNMAYRKFAWRAAGGYAVHLPAHADLNLFVTLALRHGLENLSEALAVFQAHEQRFSSRLSERRVRLAVEMGLVLRQARIYCQNSGLRWPPSGVVRGVWQQIWRGA